MGAKSKVKRRKRGEAALEPPTAFESDISSFLVWVQLEKGLSPKTVESYEKDLVQCAIHLKNQGVSSWQVVEIENLSAWLASQPSGSMQLPVWPESYLLYECLLNSRRLKIN